MHKLVCLFFSVISLHLVSGQYPFGGGDSSSVGYPRIKLAGPLGQLISGQGLGLGSGFGQVLSSLINNAGGSGGGSSVGGPLSQLATAASNTYINAIRSTLPGLGQLTGGLGGASAGQSHNQYSQYGGAGGHPMYGGMQNPLNFLTGDSPLSGYGGPQSSQYEHGNPPYSGGYHHHHHQFGGADSKCNDSMVRTDQLQLTISQSFQTTSVPLPTATVPTDTVTRTPTPRLASTRPTTHTSRPLSTIWTESRRWIIISA